jgi:hypothetical protein
MLADFVSSRHCAILREIGVANSFVVRPRWRQGVAA